MTAADKEMPHTYPIGWYEAFLKLLGNRLRLKSKIK